MPAIKIFPPKQLPDKGLSEHSFEAWTSELEVFLALGVDNDMARFLQDGSYSTWQSEETLHGRIQALNATDEITINREPNEQDKVTKREALLNKKRRELKTFLNQVAKVVSANHYNFVMRQATSLEWVYREIRKDYNIQQKGVYFFNLLDLKYDGESMTPSGFYQMYRQLVMAYTAKRDDVIKWSGETMPSDEKLSPTLEDMILLIVLGLIDPRLPGYVKSHYALKMENSRLMDFKTDIFTNIHKFIDQIDTMEQFGAFKVQSPNLSAFNKYKQNRGAANSYQKSSKPNNMAPATVFCKPCWDANKGKDVYRSHGEEDKKCPTKNKLSNIEAIASKDVIDEELQDLDTSSGIQDEVSPLQHWHECPHCVTTGLGSLQPVPTQLLTLQDSGGTPLTLELDSAPTVNYVSNREAQSRNFVIHPNTQVSRLGDGKTLLQGVSFNWSPPKLSKYKSLYNLWHF